MDPPGGCFNFDDPNITGDGDAAFVFSRLSDTFTSADAGSAGAWLYVAIDVSFYVEPEDLRDRVI